MGPSSNSIPSDPLEAPSDFAIADLERKVMAAIVASEVRGEPPGMCAIEVSRCCASGENGELGFPSVDLASVLVSNLCFSHNTPFMWKLLDEAIARGLVHPLHVLALLTSRVSPNRIAQPEAFRLYLELMGQYYLSFPVLESRLCRKKITKSIDEVLQLSRIYCIEKLDYGLMVVLLVLRVMTTVIDCALEDCGLPFASKGQVENELLQSVEINTKLVNTKARNHGQLRLINILKAFEVVGHMSSNKKTQHMLRLLHLNMPDLFNGFLQRLWFIKANKSSTEILTSVDHLLEELHSNVQEVIDAEYRPHKHSLWGLMDNTRSVNSPLTSFIGSGKEGRWISFDILMENEMGWGRSLCPRSCFERLAELARILQKLNQATWQETFQALWISALRIVQRENKPLEPVTELDARLCMLLSIIPLSIAILLKEESDIKISKENRVPSRKQGFVACLRSLGQFSSLLSPPPPVVDAANDAATKAAVFIREIEIGGRDPHIKMHRNNSSTKAMGNLLHLMVESCIARGLIDTSPYFWPGYLIPFTITTFPNSTLIEDSPWSNFMKGAPLTQSLQSALVDIPAPSSVELKKLAYLAFNGSENERLAAPKILCGASLTRNWNIQEHAVCVAVKLLSLPPMLDICQPRESNCLLGHLHMLLTTLSCLCQPKMIHIFWLFGKVPQLAAALIQLCEVFGSLSSTSTFQCSTEEETSIYSVFSRAFLFLLRLYKFFRQPQMLNVSGREGLIKLERTLDYLLFMYKANHISTNFNRNSADCSTELFNESPCGLKYIDSFPKLQHWHFRNQACLASIGSALPCNGTLLTVANKIMNVIFCKRIKGEQVVPINTSIGTAWEVLEAVPYVLEAALTACSYGQLSPRELTTGLKDLVNFFPASVAVVVSYLSAEISGGVWKNVSMNGIDWPSPCEALYIFQSEVIAVLASVGVEIGSCYPHHTPPMLPLPLAVLLSVTITWNLDESARYTRSIVGLALGNNSLYCNWLSMLTLGALWIQKAPKWQEFLTVTCSGSPFTHDQNAVGQLVHSCFKVFLGLDLSNSSYFSSNRGVVGLLGPSISNIHGLSPGVFFLRNCHLFCDLNFFSELILKSVIEFASILVDNWSSAGPTQLASGSISLAVATIAARQSAILGATLLCITGHAKTVQVLFEETVPIFLLLSDTKRHQTPGSISSMLKGYVISYFMFFSCAIVSGFWDDSPSSKLGTSQRQAHIVASHLNFMAGVFEGRIVLGCDPIMWKTHVMCFLDMLVRFAPAWIPSVKLDTLHKVSTGLKNWHEYDLALALLEFGGIGAIEAIVELFF